MDRGQSVGVKIIILGVRVPNKCSVHLARPTKELNPYWQPGNIFTCIHSQYDATKRALYFLVSIAFGTQAFYGPS